MHFDSDVLQSVDILTRAGGASPIAGLGARTRETTAGIVQDLVFVNGGGCGCRAGIFGGFFVDTVMFPPLPAFRAAAPARPVATATFGGVMVRGAGFLGRAVLAGGARVHGIELLGILVEVGFVAVGLPALRGGLPE